MASWPWITWKTTFLSRAPLSLRQFTERTPSTGFQPSFPSSNGGLSESPVLKHTHTHTPGGCLSSYRKELPQSYTMVVMMGSYDAICLFRSKTIRRVRLEDLAALLVIRLTRATVATHRWVGDGATRNQYNKCQCL